MPHSDVEREIEIKLALPSSAHGRGLLRRAGFHVVRRRVFEANTVFDTAEQALRLSGTLLRIREVNGKGLLTYKGPAQPGKHKSREEVESAFAEPAALGAILERIGFQPVFRYEKYRTEYSDGVGLATVDETPIGFYLELEGPPAWIDRSAQALGFGEADYITASYLQLYIDSCRRHAIPPGNMGFAAAPRPRRRV